MAREIVTNEYKGEDRRNGSRLKISLSDYIKIICIISGLIISGIGGWLTLKGQVKANAENVAEASIDIKDIKMVNSKQNSDILMLQTDVKEIQKDVATLVEYREKDRELLLTIKGLIERNN